MTLDDFRRLNLRDAGNWPLAPKVGILLLLFLLIVAAGAFFDWKEQYDALDQAQQAEEKLKAQYAEKKTKAVNYELYRQQLAEVEQSFGALLKQLPNRAEMDALLTDINQAGLGRGLQFELFKPAAQEKMADFYAELPIDIRITGTYHDMGAFASDIAQLPRIVTLNNVAIANEKGVLSMDAVAKTYRYLDEEEQTSGGDKPDKTGKTGKTGKSGKPGKPGTGE
jgi:type IV pilus assembly protein PilO